MATDETYNGWTNRETWAFNLHFGHDETLAEACTDAYRAAYHEATAEYPGQPEWWRGAALSAAEDAARDWFEDLAELAAELHGGDLDMAMRDIGSDWRINWRETAENIVDESEV